MDGRTAGPRTRRTVGTAALAVGLLASVGATTTTCAANASGTSKGNAVGSVVRCDGPLSCDVVLRRATTHTYAQRLHGRTASTVAAAAAAEFACLLVTRRLTTHVICVVGTTFLASKLVDALRNAAASGDCLRIHIQAPGQNRTWKPVSYGTDSGSDCAP